MKKIFLFAFLLAFSTTGFSQTLIFKEYFDNGVMPLGWGNIDQDGDGNKWKAETWYNYLAQKTESYVWSESWKETSPLTPENYLISPRIDLRGLQGSVLLRYTIQVGDGTFPAEKYKVAVSNTCNGVADFTEIIKDETCTADDYSDASLWHERIIDLTQFIGKQIYICWCHYQSPDGYIFRLDSIQVSYTTNVGLNEPPEAKDVIIFPNPAKDKLNVNGTLTKSKIQLFTLEGLQIYNSELATGHNSIDVSSFKNGIYVLRIESSKGIITRKINISH